MNHTKGPWRISYGQKKLSILPGIVGTMPKSKEGNAKLICAAPDMIEVLQKVDACFKGAELTIALMDEVQAVLRKAKGV